MDDRQHSRVDVADSADATGNRNDPDDPDDESGVDSVDEEYCEEFWDKWRCADDAVNEDSADGAEDATT